MYTGSGSSQLYNEGGFAKISRSSDDDSVGEIKNPLSRHESQKRRDWNTFLQYLRNQRPPVAVDNCTGSHVLDYVRYLDQFGKTKVHLPACPFYGQLEPPAPCACPLRQSWGSLDALISQLQAAYEENGGQPESNPFGSRLVRTYLREVRDCQAKARGISCEKKKSQKQRNLTKSTATSISSADATVERLSLSKDDKRTSSTQAIKGKSSSSSTMEFRPYKDMTDCIVSLREADYLTDSDECLGCVVYCSLFPKNYVIDKDTLIQLWMAEGLISQEPMEDTAAAYLKALSDHGGFITFLREDPCNGRTWYKVNKFTLEEHFLQMSRINPVRVVSDDPVSVLSAKSDATHVTLNQLSTNGLRTLERFTEIRMVSLLNDHKSNLQSVPRDFFMSLKHLHTLNLRRTQLSEMPTSIGSAKCLHFLDLSETLIQRLPETIDSLENLQTLKLQNCSRLVALPKATRRLTRLRHLDLGTHCNLQFMPSGIGALTCLHTLSDFVVGHQHSSCIGELKNMNDLSGKLCLSRLENIAGPDDAKESNLSSKQRLEKLELRWTKKIGQRQSTADHLTIENLRPHTDLRELQIICYPGSAFPGWISHPSFKKLVNITLFKCENCHILPSLGQLHSLVSLSLIELTGVRAIDYQFCRDKSKDHEDEYIAFPILQKLEIKSMVMLEKLSDMGRNSFPGLSKLVIKDCPKLAAVDMLSSLNALEFLEIHRCTNLPSSLKRDVPASVTTLVIEGCPELSSDCSVDAAKDCSSTSS